MNGWSQTIAPGGGLASIPAIGGVLRADAGRGQPPFSRLEYAPVVLVAVAAYLHLGWRKAPTGRSSTAASKRE